nr:hypothetical protein [Lysinibacillus timonensis]
MANAINEYESALINSVLLVVEFIIIYRVKSRLFSDLYHQIFEISAIIEAKIVYA